MVAKILAALCLVGLTVGAVAPASAHHRHVWVRHRVLVVHRHVVIVHHIHHFHHMHAM